MIINGKIKCDGCGFDGNGSFWETKHHGKHACESCYRKTTIRPASKQEQRITYDSMPEHFKSFAHIADHE